MCMKHFNAWSQWMSLSYIHPAQALLPAERPTYYTPLTGAKTARTIVSPPLHPLPTSLRVPNPLGRDCIALGRRKSFRQLFSWRCDKRDHANTYSRGEMQDVIVPVAHDMHARGWVFPRVSETIPTTHLPPLSHTDLFHSIPPVKKSLTFKIV